MQTTPRIAIFDKVLIWYLEKSTPVLMHLFCQFYLIDKSGLLRPDNGNNRPGLVIFNHPLKTLGAQ